MEVFDLKTLQAFPYEERQKNVFYQAKEFIWSFRRAEVLKNAR